VNPNEIMPAAFAAIGVSPSGDVYHQVGMTLRDWFAGQALAGTLANHDAMMKFFNGLTDGQDLVDTLAEAAFETADAMLKAREATP